MKNEILPGSIWGTSTGQKFIVISVVDIEDHTWVYYRKSMTLDPEEYSCYLESFIQRFTQLPE